MQRWFFATEELICIDDKRLMDSIPSGDASKKTSETLWKFCVTLDIGKELLPNETLALTGGCSNLGDWSLEKCVLMNRDNIYPNVWSVSVVLPTFRATFYRYLIIAIDRSTQSIMVRYWEAHLIPRKVCPAEDGSKGDCQDVFGILNGEAKVDRGWLNNESIVQFMFFKAPFTWKEEWRSDRLYHVEVIPMRRKLNEDPCFEEAGSTAFAFCEVAELTSKRLNHLHQQPCFGTKCGPNDMLLFHLTLGDFENTVYLIRLYARDPRADADEPMYDIGYQYIKPSSFICSNGYIDAAITCSSIHRSLGRMKFRYSLIHPCERILPLNMSKTFSRYWNVSRQPLDVGHRGQGKSFKSGQGVVLENTLRSFRNAIQHGADMVEFDVQLTKDHVPVIFHDFMVRISIKYKKIVHGLEGVQVPLIDLSYNALMNLKMQYNDNWVCVKDVEPESRLFPTLTEVLQDLPGDIAFNVEVKWSQQMVNGRWEENYHPCISRNVYIDCILESVFNDAGGRRIIFSCFDADMCSLLRFKQNVYPVMFLMSSPSDIQYRDPRCSSLPPAVGFASAIEILGLVLHSDHILRNPTFLYFLNLHRNLIFFCYGGNELDRANIQKLKSLGIKAVIFDRMDLMTSKTVMKSVFLIEAERINLNEILTDESVDTSQKDLVSRVIRRFEKSLIIDP